MRNRITLLALLAVMLLVLSPDVLMSGNHALSAADTSPPPPKKTRLPFKEVFDYRAFMRFERKRLLDGGRMHLGCYSHIHVVSPDENFLITGGKCARVKMWKLPSMELAWDMTLKCETLTTSAVFSRDGKYVALLIASLGRSELTRKEIFKIAVHDILTGKRVAEFRIPDSGHMPNAIFFGMEDSQISVLNRGGEITRWSMPLCGSLNKKMVRKWISQLGDSSYQKRLQAQAKLHSMGEAVLPYLEQAKSSPDREISAAADDIIKNLNNLLLLNTQPAQKSGVVLCAYSAAPDRVILVNETAKRVRVVDYLTGNILFENPYSQSKQCAIAVSPDGMYLAESFSESQKVILYKFNKASGKFEKNGNNLPLPENTSVGLDFTSDSKSLMVRAGHTIGFYRARKLRPIFECKLNFYHEIESVRLSPKGGFCTISLDYGGFRVYKVCKDKIEEIEIDRGEVFCGTAELSPDGKLVANTTLDQGPEKPACCVVREVATGKTVQKIPIKHRTFCFDYRYYFSYNSKYIAIESLYQKKQGIKKELTGARFQLVEIASGKTLWSNDAAGYNRVCGFSTNDDILYTTAGKDVCLHETVVGRLIERFKCPSEIISSALAPNGNYLYVILKNESSVMIKTFDMSQLWTVTFRMSLEKHAVFARNDTRKFFVTGFFEYQKKPRAISGGCFLDTRKKYKWYGLDILLPIAPIPIYYYWGFVGLQFLYYHPDSDMLYPFNERTALWRWMSRRNNHVVGMWGFSHHGGVVGSMRGFSRNKHFVIAFSNGSVWQWKLKDNIEIRTTRF